MDGKKALIKAALRTLCATLDLLSDTLEAEPDSVKTCTEKLRAVAVAARVVVTLRTVLCADEAVEGDDDVNDPKTVEEYHAEVERRLAALDAQIERKHEELGRTGASSGKARRAPRDEKGAGSEGSRKAAA